MLENKIKAIRDIVTEEITRMNDSRHFFEAVIKGYTVNMICFGCVPLGSVKCKQFKPLVGSDGGGYDENTKS